MRPPCRVAAILTGLVSAAAPARAAELWSSGDDSLNLRTSFKTSLLLSRAPDDPLLFPDRDGATSFWRLRLEPAARLGPSVTVALAYEHRLRVFSQAGAGFGILPPESRAPGRIRQLDWPVAESGTSSWRHEIDRAYVALHLRRVELTAGRQAIGWGRGVLFGAVDVFSPFTPLEADREWRRGVDALRADVRISDRASLDLVGAFGAKLDASTFAARLRGYAGKADLELVGGRRTRDLFAGLTSSAAVGDAELHGELALFRAPEPLAGDGDRRLAVKAVAGGSYRFAVANGLVVWAEYHYSGYGARDAAGIAGLMADPSFKERLARGDAQILGRHALGLLASLEVSPELTLGAQWLQSPVDGSGLAASSATVTFGDKISLLLAVYLPFGRGPRGPTLRSEYGASPRCAFVQVRIYE
jgi:hypothetical protein